MSTPADLPLDFELEHLRSRPQSSDSPHLTDIEQLPEDAIHHDTPLRPHLGPQSFKDGGRTCSSVPPTALGTNRLVEDQRLQSSTLHPEEDRDLEEAVSNATAAEEREESEQHEGGGGGGGGGEGAHNAEHGADNAFVVLRDDGNVDQLMAEAVLKDFDYDPIDSGDALLKDYPKLDYKPFQLKTWFLTLALTFFMACVASIASLVVWGQKNNGALHVDSFHAHLAFRYGPPIVGTITVIWWRSIMQNLGRFTPYFSMAAQRGASGKYDISSWRNQRVLHTNYADFVSLPTLINLRAVASNGHWLFFTGILTQMVLNLFLVALKSSFIQSTPSNGGWDVVISHQIGYALISLYAVLIFCILSMLIRLHNRETGLKWDPVSIADQLALVQGSNIWPMFANLEYCHRGTLLEAFRNRASHLGLLRLGYWKHRNDESIWHGLALVPGLAGMIQSFVFVRSVRKNTAKPCGSPDPDDIANSSHEAPSQRRSEQKSNTRSAAQQTGAGITQRRVLPPAGLIVRGRLSDYMYPMEEMQSDQHRNRLDRFEKDVAYLAKFRYRDFNIFLSDISLFFYGAAALGALAATIVGLANHNIQHGFNFTPLTVCSPGPCLQLISTPDQRGSRSTFDAEAAFLFRFLPVEIMALFSALWVNADLFYRSTESFGGMNDAAPATSNLLLDYPSSMPIAITFKAAQKGHWRVALFSLYSLLGTIPPIIATSIFVSTPVATDFKIKAQPASFWFCFSILSVYLFTLPVVRPTAAYRLPRRVLNIADLLSYCYASRALEDEILNKSIFSVQDPTDTRTHLVSQIHLARRKYQFGFYVGKDGHTHLGFDVAERQNSLGSIDVVHKVDPGRVLYLGSGGFRLYFRPPRII